jgi:DNA-binding transcriptional regulator GbsR (MarR family)
MNKLKELLTLIANNKLSESSNIVESVLSEKVKKKLDDKKKSVACAMYSKNDDDDDDKDDDDVNEQFEKTDKIRKRNIKTYSTLMKKLDKRLSLKK